MVNGRIFPETLLEMERLLFTKASFRVPADWGSDGLVAHCNLPLRRYMIFTSHPGSAYIDGQPFCLGRSRHHQEFCWLTATVMGDSHSLALHGWAEWRHR